MPPNGDIFNHIGAVEEDLGTGKITGQEKNLVRGHRQDNWARKEQQTFDS